MSCELDMSITLGDYNTVKRIITRNPPLVNGEYARKSQSPLMVAVVNDDSRIIDLLLKHQAVVTEPILCRAAGIQVGWSFNYPIMEGLSLYLFRRLLKSAAKEVIQSFSSDYPTCRLSRDKRVSLEDCL